MYRMIIRKTPDQLEKMAAAGAVHSRCMRMLASKVSRNLLGVSRLPNCAINCFQLTRSESPVGISGSR